MAVLVAGRRRVSPGAAAGRGRGRAPPGRGWRRVKIRDNDQPPRHMPRRTHLAHLPVRVRNVHDKILFSSPVLQINTTHSERDRSRARRSRITGIILSKIKLNNVAFNWKSHNGQRTICRRRPKRRNRWSPIWTVLTKLATDR